MRPTSSAVVQYVAHEHVIGPDREPVRGSTGAYELKRDLGVVAVIDRGICRDGGRALRRVPGDRHDPSFGDVGADRLEKVEGGPDPAEGPRTVDRRNDEVQPVPGSG